MVVRARRLAPITKPLLTLVVGLCGCASHDPEGRATSMDASAEADARAGEAAAPGDDAGLGAQLREVKLVDHSAWQNYARELDPLASHQPAAIDCGITAWLIERGAIEVDTGQCDYLLVEHPALVDVAAGSEIELELWHFDLVAPEPAMGHVALLFDTDIQWEMEFPIPSLADLQRTRFRTTRALAAGEPIRLHLHNHGQNTWALGDVFAYVP